MKEQEDVINELLLRRQQQLDSVTNQLKSGVFTHRGRWALQNDEKKFTNWIAALTITKELDLDVTCSKSVISFFLPTQTRSGKTIDSLVEYKPCSGRWRVIRFENPSHWYHSCRFIDIIQKLLGDHAWHHS